MQGTIAPTDYEWYESLRGHPETTELNFWTPSAHYAFRAEPWSPFLFKLKAPHNAICGFASFVRYSRLPPWLAWECFGAGNGCDSLEAMEERIGRIRRRIRHRGGRTQEIGCILVVGPVWFGPEEWVPQPGDWPARSVRATRYDLGAGEGARVWQDCLERAQARPEPAAAVADELGTAHYGPARLIAPRLGQGTFRISVMEAYGRACAVTGEHSLPALEAAHIQPFGQEGPHDVRNGLFLRADLHRLFDQGYVTVTPDLSFSVSDRLREDFDNGHSYYPLSGARLHLPPDAAEAPAPVFLEWHNRHVFLS